MWSKSLIHTEIGVGTAAGDVGNTRAQSSEICDILNFYLVFMYLPVARGT